MTMAIIDKIVGDIEKRVTCYGDWHVEIVSHAGMKGAQEKDSYLWDARSPVAAKAIKDYLVALGMNDGIFVEPKGSFIHIKKVQNEL